MARIEMRLGLGRGKHEGWVDAGRGSSRLIAMLGRSTDEVLLWLIEEEVQRHQGMDFRHHTFAPVTKQYGYFSV